MTDEAPVQAPTDIKDVAIHLSYMRRDMQKMQSSLDNITSNYVPISVFIEVKADVEHLKIENEKRKEYQDTQSGKMWGISATVGALVTAASFILNHFVK